MGDGATFGSMKAALLMTGLLLGVPAYAGSLSPDFYTANLAYIESRAQAAGFRLDDRTLHDFRAVARFTHSVSLEGAATDSNPPLVPNGVLWGELWFLCIGEPTNAVCDSISTFGQGFFPCAEVPVGSSLNVWTPNAAVVTLPDGTYYAWTMNHLGLGPLSQHLHGATFFGSGCVLSNTLSLRFFVGDGIMNY